MKNRIVDDDNIDNTFVSPDKIVKLMFLMKKKKRKKIMMMVVMIRIIIV